MGYLQVRTIRNRAFADDQVRVVLAEAVGTVWVRYRTELWQAWIIGVPVLVTLGLNLLDDVAALLQNLM